MLIKDYYIIDSVLRKEDGTVCFNISLCKDSVVYKGHFPNYPISPGVCNIQMIKECAEYIVGRHLQIQYIQQCRLTTLVTPLKHHQLEVNIHLQEEDTYILKATLGKGENIYLSLHAELKNSLPLL